MLGLQGGVVHGFMHHQEAAAHFHWLMMKVALYHLPNCTNWTFSLCAHFLQCTHLFLVFRAASPNCTEAGNSKTYAGMMYCIMWFYAELRYWSKIQFSSQPTGISNGSGELRCTAIYFGPTDGNPHKYLTFIGLDWILLRWCASLFIYRCIYRWGQPKKWWWWCCYTFLFIQRLCKWGQPKQWQLYL